MIITYILTLIKQVSKFNRDKINIINKDKVIITLIKIIIINNNTTNFLKINTIMNRDTIDIFFKYFTIFLYKKL